MAKKLSDWWNEAETSTDTDILLYSEQEIKEAVEKERKRIYSEYLKATGKPLTDFILKGFEEELRKKKRQ